jgi:hypothetical protein
VSDLTLQSRRRGRTRRVARRSAQIERGYGRSNEDSGAEFIHHVQQPRAGSGRRPRRPQPWPAGD